MAERDSEVIAADFLIGERIINSRGEDLGRVEEIMVDVESGRVLYAIVSFGAVFGLGEKLFPLPWRALRPDPANRQFVLDVTRERLKNAPGFDRFSWPSMRDPQWVRSIHRFYGQTPGREDVKRRGLAPEIPEDAATEPRHE